MTGMREEKSFGKEKHGLQSGAFWKQPRVRDGTDSPQRHHSPSLSGKFPRGLGGTARPRCKRGVVFIYNLCNADTHQLIETNGFDR